MITLLEATTPDGFREVRALMHAFIAWHRERHRAEAALIDRYFDPVEFEAELNALPGVFARPRGRLLLAHWNGQPAGCIALRNLGAGACEMKRMFVYPEFHGKGIGRALAQAVIDAARQIGYSVMRLDTGARQHEAQGLYRKLGFQTAAPHYALPEDMRRWLVFMEMELT